MAKNIRKQVFYPNSPDELWEVLTNPQEISQWLMATLDFKPEKGRKFTLQAKPMGGWDGKINGEVLLADKPRVLSYTWKGSNMKSNTVLTWTLTPKGDGTILTMEHTGFEGLGDFILGVFHAMGWPRFLKQLMKQLEIHAKQKV